jgi:hypothetical protein
MNTSKLIGSPVLLALVIIFGGASWAILGFFGATSSTLEMYALAVALAAGLNLACMMKNIVKPPESKPQGLGLNTGGHVDDKQQQRTKDTR